jgi:hypothetical protein
VSDRSTLAPPTERRSVERRRTRTAALVTALVVALALVGIGVALQMTADDGPEGGSAAASVRASTTAEPEPLVPTPPAAPTGLDARTKPFAVALRWSPDTSAGPIEGYTVYRNGTEIATVSESEGARFTDGDVIPLVRYTYAVAAFGEDDVASEPAELRVRTPAAPMSFARLEGTFDVRIDEVSTFGYTSTGGDTTGGWAFTPKCKRGSCDVKVARVFRGSASVTMSRRGASYRAQGTAKLGVKCGGTPSTSTYTIALDVVKARTVEGVWHAVAIEGTFTHREAPQLGCVAGGADLAFTGRLVDL